ncbi:hypothetical protein LOK49_LG01G04216 [Camellia lanceoleosa]|uniref:Uncharacterized protein n=1 Tax=Camellia lanceoleosa TaxID=1840588 RepID=A0ACC0IZL7_9ERIC|nr:hypothetical protein LOK49_LG01G04216 [Camellia lanceoleosa]
MSAGVDMEMEGEDNDGVEGEEEKSVKGYGLTVSLHAPKLHMSVVSRYLEQQTRRQQHEQHHPYQYWSPIRHFQTNSNSTQLNSTHRSRETRSRVCEQRDLVRTTNAEIAFGQREPTLNVE